MKKIKKNNNFRGNSGSNPRGEFFARKIARPAQPKPNARKSHPSRIDYRTASVKDLAEHARHLLPFLDRRVSRALCSLAKRLLGRNYSRRAARLMGCIVYYRVANDGCMPPLKQLQVVAHAMNKEVHLLMEEPGNRDSKCQLRMVLGKEFDLPALTLFMQRIYLSRKAAQASPALRAFQLKELSRISSKKAPVRWSNLIMFFAACGYQLNVRLEDAPPSSLFRLLSRLDYPA